MSGSSIIRIVQSTCTPVETGLMRLLLIRHGQTPANVLGQLDTALPGAGLSDLGQGQAREVPNALRDERIDAIYSSDRLRARQTAEPLARDRGTTVGVLDGLEEIGAGSLEMRSDHAAHRAYILTIFAWAGGDLDTRMPGGESGREFFGRFDAAIATVAGAPTSDDFTAAVVSHAAAIRVWVSGRARNVPGSFAAEHQLENTGVGTLSGSPAGWTLLTWMGTPIGGAEFEDPTAEDPTGELLADS